MSSLETDRQARSPSDTEIEGGERQRDGYLRKQWPDKTIQSQLVELTVIWALQGRLQCCLSSFTLTHTALRSVFAFLRSYSLLIFLHLQLCIATPLSLSGAYVFVFLHRNGCVSCVYAEMSFSVCVRWIMHSPISCVSMYTDHTEQHTDTGSLSISLYLCYFHTHSL